jgi:hypothetical protein
MEGVGQKGGINKGEGGSNRRKGGGDLERFNNTKAAKKAK